MSADLLSELETVAGLSGQAQREAPGELLLADSCSWRRILTVTGRPYIVPTNDRSDGHPNLDCGPDWVCAKEAVASVNFLRAHHAEIAAAVRDAKRYRWLRRKDAWKEVYLSITGGISAIFVSDGRTGHATDGTELDAAIDAAMSQEGEG